MAENYLRVKHIQRAAKLLEDKSAKLVRHTNNLRHEKITGEKEVILPSAVNI